MQSKYSSFAARRYRQYRRQERKKSAKKKIVAFLLRLFMMIVGVLQKARILRRKVETIRVEDG
jgi:hypothetical protein